MYNSPLKRIGGAQALYSNTKHPYALFQNREVIVTVMISKTNFLKIRACNDPENH